MASASVSQGGGDGAENGETSRMREGRNVITEGTKNI